MANRYSKEELDIVEAIEGGKFKSIESLDEEKKRYSEYAANTLRKDKRVNIRISERDLQSIQRKAIEEGIPYQTLISSLLHKYINGRLVDINSLNQVRGIGK
ncbi:MAG: antitoxin [Spirochaetales bacterium]|nr:antitoxin [Spirochaetales bacterium]